MNASGLTVDQEAKVQLLEQRAHQMDTMSSGDFRKLREILYDFRVMANRLNECREIMDANDPLNAAELFGSPEARESK